MKKAWTVIGTLILVLLAAGVVSAGIGLLTGASLDRMVENIFGGWETLKLYAELILGELGPLFKF